jgi:hypothetical protein
VLFIKVSEFSILARLTDMRVRRDTRVVEC